MPENHSEEAARMASRVLAGEKQAYVDFQRAYRRLFLSLLLSLDIPPFEAEDLTESAITDILCDKLAKWNPEGGNFDGWVMTIVRNIGLEWLRERSKAPTMAFSEGFDRAAKPTEKPDPNRAAAVHEAMAKLSSVDRMIIELREFEDDRPYAEIAIILSGASGKPVTEGAARVRHKRALDRMSEFLRDDPRVKIRHMHFLQGEDNERPEERQGS
jgi:RNA polymerase sigma factor (sigma-70 family)